VVQNPKEYVAALFPEMQNTNFSNSWILAGYTIAIKGQKAERVKEDWVRVQVWKELDPLDNQVKLATLCAVFLLLTGEKDYRGNFSPTPSIAGSITRRPSNGTIRSTGSTGSSIEGRHRRSDSGFSEAVHSPTQSGSTRATRGTYRLVMHCPGTKRFLTIPGMCKSVRECFIFRLTVAQYNRDSAECFHPKQPNMRTVPLA
jgi:hypothetical protein